MSCFAFARLAAAAVCIDLSRVFFVFCCCVRSYYRHFRLYKYVLAKRPKLVLTQRAHSLVEQPPKKLRPLSAALLEG